MAYTARVRLQPALTLDVGTAKNAVAVMREVFDELKRAGNWAEA
jgi:hypothetical protein